MSNTINSHRVTFPVTLYLALNSETGEEYLVRTRKEWEDEAKLALADYDQVLAGRAEGGEKKDGLDRLRVQFLAQQKAFLDRVIRDSDIARPAAKVYEYTLVKPLYGDLDRIRGEATEMDYSTGSSNWNEAKYRRLLMENEGIRENNRTLTAQDIAGLAPAIGEELGARLARAVSPDQRRLVFTLPPSTDS